jgi:hypothetical protein
VEEETAFVEGGQVMICSLLILTCWLGVPYHIIFESALHLDSDSDTVYILTGIYSLIARHCNHELQ